jgi:hypothetical protein
MSLKYEMLLPHATACTQLCRLPDDARRGKEGLEFAVADARRADALPDSHFDFCVDAGLMDTLACSFEPEQDVLSLHKEVSAAPPRAHAHAHSSA